MRAPAPFASPPLRLAAVAAGLVLLGGAAALALARRGEAATPVTVRVTALDYRFVLTRRRVPAGSVRFVVTNRGAIDHDFAIGRA